jgi:hypothetical protein
VNVHVDAEFLRAADRGWETGLRCSERGPRMTKADYGFGGWSTLAGQQRCEAIKRGDEDMETLRSISRSYCISSQTIATLSL